MTAVAAVAAGSAGYLAFMQGLPKIDPADSAQVESGRRIYDAHCAACHGLRLEGQPDWQTRLPNGRLPAPPHDRSGHTWHHADEALFRMIRDGVQAVAPPGYQSDMPAYRDVLGDADIAAVLAYIKAQWPAEIRARQQGLSQR